MYKMLAITLGFIVLLKLTQHEIRQTMKQSGTWGHSLSLNNLAPLIKDIHFGTHSL